MNYNLTAEQDMIVRSVPITHVVSAGNQALIDFAASRHDRLLEMDVNPLMITPDRCIAADVTIRQAVH
ncbi:MAG: hypothetical protein ACO3DT_00930 [Gammaproteobacteria bacterium]